jgi:hypothetical protein
MRFLRRVLLEGRMHEAAKVYLNDRGDHRWRERTRHMVEDRVPLDRLSVINDNTP